MDRAAAFGWGFLGSLAIEVVVFCRKVRGDRSSRIPALYRKPAFIVGRVLLALVAGVVAAAWGINQPIQGLVLGAGTPRLVVWLESQAGGPEVNKQ